MVIKRRRRTSPTAPPALVLPALVLPALVLPAATGRVGAPYRQDAGSAFRPQAGG
ncbi:hypothetical protein [Streptomyces sp. NPDC051567]|uniref:hypothetical protein n=1 Tax=Streptomyces sp. NPDC051567 TaxID=3365660 RepID=UPI0037AC431F